MGQAKQSGKKTRTERLLAEQPMCVFCGGDTPAHTSDHVPPRGLFERRHRPTGLEFSACIECNSGARKHEQLVQFISLIDSDSTSELEKEYNEKVVNSALRHNPKLEDELVEKKTLTAFEKIAVKQIKPDGGHLMNVRGDTINNAMLGFASKLGMALHYEATKRIVPLSGFMHPSWYGNAGIIEGRQMLPLDNFLSEERTLKQGEWSVADQFVYSSAWTEDGDASMHRARFRTSFAIEVIVGFDVTAFPEPSGTQKHYRPGFLRGYPPAPLGTAI